MVGQAGSGVNGEDQAPASHPEDQREHQRRIIAQQALVQSRARQRPHTIPSESRMSYHRLRVLLMTVGALDIAGLSDNTMHRQAGARRESLQLFRCG